MIKINNLEIINKGQQLAINVETNVGFNISSILLWTMDSFKDYSLAINLSDELEQVNEKEVLIINANELGILKFEDIVFIELESTFVDVDECLECQSPALGITYNLSSYYSCLMSYLTELSQHECLTCNDNNANTMTININMLIDMVEKSLEIGYYVQAIDIIKKLKKLCSFKTCNSCPTIECSACNKFKQQ